MMRKYLLIPLLFFSGWANAGLMCDARYANNTIQNDGCELGTTNNDSTTQVNLDLMFGFDDWLQVWKNDSGDALPPAITDFTLSANELSGAFTIQWGGVPDINQISGDVMFVLKDGQDDPDTYVGWLLDPGNYGIENYAYNTPFLNTSTNVLKEISHASFYYRDGGPTTRNCVEGDPNCTFAVPVPGTLALMGFGLLFMRARSVSQRAKLV